MCPYVSFHGLTHKLSRMQYSLIQYIHRCTVSAVDDEPASPINWLAPSSPINRQLLPHFEELYRQVCGTNTRSRNIKDELLIPSQRAVIKYGLTLDVVRCRFTSFRANAAAVSKALRASKLRTAFSAGSAQLLAFITGEYTTSEPGMHRVKVLADGSMQYRQHNRWVTAEGKFRWSTKLKGVYIIGAGSVWRLDILKSSDKTLVWTKSKGISEGIECTQITYTRVVK